jgi:hypothetical protein
VVNLDLAVIAGRDQDTIDAIVTYVVKDALQVIATLATTIDPPAQKQQQQNNSRKNPIALISWKNIALASLPLVP